MLTVLFIFYLFKQKGGNICLNLNNRMSFVFFIGVCLWKFSSHVKVLTGASLQVLFIVLRGRQKVVFRDLLLSLLSSSLLFWKQNISQNVCQNVHSSFSLQFLFCLEYWSVNFFLIKELIFYCEQYILILCNVLFLVAFITK